MTKKTTAKSTKQPTVSASLEKQGGYPNTFIVTISATAKVQVTHPYNKEQLLVLLDGFQEVIDDSQKHDSEYVVEIKGEVYGG